MMEHHPHRRPSSIVPPTPLVKLVDELSFQATGKARFVPSRVQTALERLQQLHGPCERKGDDVERQSLLHILGEYRDIVRDVEKRGFETYHEFQRYQESLFSFLDSPRTLADFHTFCRKTEFPKGMLTLRNELFSQNAPLFLEEVQASLRTTLLHTHLPFFLELIGSTHITQAQTAGNLLEVLTTLYVRQILPDTNLIMRVVNQGHVPAPMVHKAVESLRLCADIDCKDDLFNFFLLGHAVADTFDTGSCDARQILRSHPIAEFGFIRQTIRKLSIALPEPGDHTRLCQLYELIPEYFVYLESDFLQWCISSLQRAVIGALDTRDPTECKELAFAAREILQQPWESDITLLWNLCASPSPNDVELLDVCEHVLGHALSSGENLLALKEEVFKRVRKGDRKATRQLENIGRLAERLLHTEHKNPKRSSLARNTLELLLESPAAAKMAIPSIMRLLGVPAISFGPFGVFCLPWSVSPHPDPEVRTAARDLMLTMPNYLGPFGLFRIERSSNPHVPK